MDIQRNGSQPSGKGPADYFTGSARIDPLFQAPDPARVRGASVTFEPGARTAWHTHPLGQTLIVTSGRGWVQAWGGPVEEIHPGDVVWFPPGEKHWHGATPTTAMAHIAIQEALDGGARLLTGGRREGRFIRPAVLTDVRPELRIWNEEVFGPVVVVDRYREFERAVARIDDSRFGIHAGMTP